MTDSTASRRHRGGLILVLGILGLILCFPLGIAAWAMGNRDVAAMSRGEMDPSGRGLTLAGKICGIAGVVLQVGLLVLSMVLWAATGRGEPTVYEDRFERAAPAESLQAPVGHPSEPGDPAERAEMEPVDR